MLSVFFFATNFILLGEDLISITGSSIAGDSMTDSLMTDYSGTSGISTSDKV